MSQPNPSHEEWLDRYRRECERVKQRACDSVTGVLPKLQELGIQTVRIEYDGYGDSGTVEGITAAKEDGTTVELPDDVHTILTDAAHNILPGGWENNDGAFGVLVIDVAGRSITREHNWRVESSEYEEEVMSL